MAIYRVKKAKEIKARYEKNKYSIIKQQSEYKRRRRQKDMGFRLLDSLRARVCDAIKGGRMAKTARTIELLGCNIEELRIYLEQQFYVNPRTGEMMSWDNYGKYGWHIDHIKPCSLFNLTNSDQQRECFHYTNLQPLWWFDNLSKSDKFIKKEI